MKRTRLGHQSIPRWAYLLFIVLAVFVLYRIFQHRAAVAKASQPPVRAVLVAKVITKDVPLYLDEIGTCSAYETVQVQAQVSGQITARHFQDGADVKQGDLLFTIDPRPYQAALDQAHGQLGQAQSKMLLDQITLKRQQELRARNVISPQDLDTAQATVKSDEAMVKTAEGAVAAAQVNLDFCNIRSPIKVAPVCDLSILATLSPGEMRAAAVQCCSPFRDSIRFIPISLLPSLTSRSCAST